MGNVPMNILEREIKSQVGLFCRENRARPTIGGEVSQCNDDAHDNRFLPSVY